MLGVGAVAAIFLILLADFGSGRVAMLVFLTLPFALVGAVIATFLTGGVLSLGSLVGLVTVIGISARNGIMLVSHYRHLELAEGGQFGRDLIVRGSEERLAPILMTALATGLALVPIVLGGSRAGYEIEHPLAVVILGGLVTSTLLNLFIVPALYCATADLRQPPRKTPCELVRRRQTCRRQGEARCTTASPRRVEQVAPPRRSCIPATALERAASAMSFGNPSGNRQPETGPFRRPNPDEPLEDAFLDPRVQSRGRRR